MGTVKQNSADAADTTSLARPAAYPYAIMEVECKETHISWIFLAGDFVYKVKKPVRYDFLDFTTIELREQACRDEVRLNQRLAPNIYLDVVPVTLLPNGQLHFGGIGRTIDWAVRMRRLPANKMLDELLRTHAVREDQIDHVADILAAFYSKLTAVRLVRHEYVRRCFEHVHDNREELLAASQVVPEELVKRTHAIQLQVLFLRTGLFAERATQGWIREGHGDLRPEHICLTDPPVVFDCVEFSRDLRTLDVVDDLAFLVEECDFLGAKWVGERLVARFHDLIGDRVAPMLWAFYKSYRACVRAKVAALRADQMTGAPRVAAIASANQRLLAAFDHTCRWETPLVVAVGGLSGAGKSTLAAELARRLGAELLNTDSVRRSIYGIQNDKASIDSGIYQPAARRRVYDELFSEAGRLHRQRLSVILDGTFAGAELIQSARSIADDARGCFLAVEVTCRPEVALARIERRRSAGIGPSDARADVFRRQQERWTPWPIDVPQCTVDSEQPLDSQLHRIAEAFGAKLDTEDNSGWLPNCRER
jgi:aminoglycoside phosphotransferase family enzyme/predicted kinase